ncbi:TetR/AcrR family transcriptional regulator [Amycolatopsis samaneae]|uniref:TetR/AcrR family transcriptional regulator n=1 Tax=Amycolatopsis samaneae TaxID=664691 RepID=A0ABW5GA78_9PSEU
MVSGTPRRRRDPEGRRRAIAAAAAELIIEVGVEATTHRMVAARADVPLGATTHYFDSLDDLRSAGLRLLVAEVDAYFEKVSAVLAARGTSAAVLTDLVMAELADSRTARADGAVVTAAVHDPRVRELARRWQERAIALLRPGHGATRAAAAALFLDGLTWHRLVSDAPLDRRVIETGLTAILGEGPPPSAAPSPSD